LLREESYRLGVADVLATMRMLGQTDDDPLIRILQQIVTPGVNAPAVQFNSYIFTNGLLAQGNIVLQSSQGNANFILQPADNNNPGRPITQPRPDQAAVVVSFAPGGEYINITPDNGGRPDQRSIVLFPNPDGGGFILPPRVDMDRPQIIIPPAAAPSLLFAPHFDGRPGVEISRPPAGEFLQIRVLADGHLQFLPNLGAATLTTIDQPAAGAPALQLPNTPGIITIRPNAGAGRLRLIAGQRGTWNLQP
jgi:hypothetical protein